MSNKKVSQLDSALSIALLDLLLLTQVDSNAETGYSSKKITVSDLANKLTSDIQYATDLPDFTDKTITGAIEELRELLISQLPISTASGAIANFTTDLALPLKSLKVEIKPKQASGTPTPSNPLPISGTDTIIVTQTGVNLWDEQWEVGTIDATTGDTGDSATNIRSKYFCPIKGNITYGYIKPDGLWTGFFWYDANQDYISVTAKMSGSTGTFTSPANARYFKLRMGGSGTTITTYGNDTSLNYPSTDTTYHAHVTATTKTVSLPETVYGGEVDCIGGSGENTWGEVDLSQVQYTTTSWGGYKITIDNCKPFAGASVATCLASKYATTSYNDLSTNKPNNSIAIATTGNVYLVSDNPPTGQFVFELATPTQITLANPIELTAKAGVNNVFGDTDGNTSVEYRESVQKYIDEQIASVQALVL